VSGDPGAPADGETALAPPEPPLPDAAWAWAVLDIAPTDDETGIRRAYVRRLKAIDPDNDAPAFIELREARDLVLYLAWRAKEGPAPVPDGADGHRQSAAETAPAPPLEPPAQEPGEREQPEIDPESFTDIERMLFGDEPTDADALRRAAEALFAHPALDRITMSESVENWAVNVIVKSSPRSDPMLDLAIERFGWAGNLSDWQRPPVLDWILERRRDAGFEHGLIAADPKYVDVLAALRTPAAAPPEKPSWALADGVRAFQGYARQHHPTSIALCDRDAMAWWDNWLANPPFLYSAFGGLARAWTGRGDPDRIFGEERSVTPPLLVGAFLLPWIFAWALMRPGYARHIRISALVWLAIFSAGMLLRPPLPEPARGPGQPFSSQRTAPELDLNPVLSRITHGRLDLIGLETSNPRLHAALVTIWSAAEAGDEFAPSLDHRVVILMEDFYRDALRAAPPAIQRDYWRLKLDEMNWLGQYGGRFCAQLSRDQGYANSYRFPEEIRDRALDLRVSIWRSVGADPPPRGERVSIPGPIVAAAARRAHLDESAMNAAMLGNGTDENLCAARIALAETELARPPAESARLLRDLTSLE
jgi:hypothetical protein